ncbi:hypothetical protein RHGRI_033234 [Rhododendron griersonianum]|uniref:Uncharacterized protein n=1 Tax=Rhododendron griersonianum TaxID=479676 RepID=A0AAV6HWU4_9ERIC|nr:hypothetical protein RHGRI_033234 [Rhododendron griersonianum]
MFMCNASSKQIHRKPRSKSHSPSTEPQTGMECTNWIYHQLKGLTVWKAQQFSHSVNQA